MKLKPWTYISIDDAKDWLKIKPENDTQDRTLIRLINTACRMVEQYISGPVITRQFQEDRDGNSSDVIVPTYWPVQSIVEIRIDYNRGFGDSTIIDSDQTILRGLPSLSQKKGDLSVKIEGTDVVLRDDNNTALLGRIFAGSIVQSIRLTYTAGWGATSEDLPEDLVQATMMVLEYFYMLRENRDLGVNSRSNMGGQEYRREKTDTGLPTEVTLILDQYKDYSLGTTEVPQKNTFVL